MLTGKYNSGDAKKFKQYTASQFATILKSLQVVHKIAEKDNATIAQVIIAWYMKNPDVSIVIPGARLPQQVDQNVQALDVELRNSDYHTIDEAFSDFAY